MSLTASESSFVSKSTNVIKVLMAQYGLLVELDALWAGSPDYDSTITQGDLDSVASFSGLTTAQLADAEFALSTIKTAISDHIASLSFMETL